MPILWKYLIRSYFQFFLLCVSSFVAVLLVVRFQDIALFASSGAGIRQIGLFTLYQIPYILPIAIPISSLIAAMNLCQKMSTSLEITALRSCGLSIKTIAYPLLLVASILSLINFTIASEMAPLTRTLAKELIFEIANENPLIVMQKDSAIDLKTFDFDLKNMTLGKKAEEVICIMRQNSNERIGLFTAKEISIDKHWIYGKSISIVSSVDPEFQSYDHLIIENQENMKLNKSAITAHLFNKEWFGKDDLLTLQEIIKKHHTRKKSLTSKSSIEILRRICLGICPFTFTLIGIAFGIDISRRKRKDGIFWALFLAALIMISFIAAKTLYKASFISILLYLLPHPIAILASLRSFRFIAQGVE